MFNWNVLAHGGKYAVGGDTEQNERSGDEPVRKNAHLEALQYNPAERLVPIQEEEIKRKIATMEPATQKRTTKLLAKIDESMLSAAARNVQTIVDSPSSPKRGQWKPPVLGAVGKLKPIFAKLPSFRNEVS